MTSSTSEPADLEDLLRRLAPQVLGAVVRRYGHFGTAEDATQEALIAAATQWPAEGIPGNPKAWLILVAARRLTDLLRAEQARTRREAVAFTAEPEPASAGRGVADDDSLILLFMCCHPALTPEAQIALTLRAAGGLTTAQIARAFLVSEDTMTRRITRAKQRIKESGIRFAMPGSRDRDQRLAAVLHVLYVIFTEGYVADRTDLAAEAIRLTRMAYQALPADGEVAGLLALELLTDARRAARTSPTGELIPMAEQDRSRWNAAYIAEGVALVTAALRQGPAGPYQLQAAIAALHDEAPSADATDWPQIVALYELLIRISPDNPAVRLNHAVAVGMAEGPAAGLALLGTLTGTAQTGNALTGNALAGTALAGRRLAVRAHLLEMAGQAAQARDTYRAAARQATSLRQQRYLNSRAEKLLSPERPVAPPPLSVTT